MAKDFYIVDEDRAVKSRYLIWERVRWPRVNPAFNERHVSFDVQGSILEV